MSDLLERQRKLQDAISLERAARVLKRRYAASYHQSVPLMYLTDMAARLRAEAEQP